jgi:hypothetical protein
MFAILFAEVDWNQAFYYGLVGGGGGMVLLAIVQFIRMMFASKEEAKLYEAQQGTYIAALGLGAVFLIGGIYLKNYGVGVSTDSNDLASFREFVSKEGRFKAKFPGNPKEQSKGAFAFSIKMFAIEEKDGTMGVAYMDLPNGTEKLTSQQIDAGLSEARKAIIHMLDARLISESPVNLRGKYKGREFKGEVPSINAELFCSMYFVKGRVYQVMIFGKDFWMNSDKARKFLNSFSVIE